MASGNMRCLKSLAGRQLGLAVRPLRELISFGFAVCRFTGRMEMDVGDAGEFTRCDEESTEFRLGATVLLAAEWAIAEWATTREDSWCPRSL